MNVLSLKFNCALENIEGMRLVGEMNNEEKQASITEESVI
jgi:hypothetical protein